MRFGDRLALMLHGFPELNYSWRLQMPMLARGWRVWAPNLRGYGASSKPEGVRAYALDHLTDDVAALIDASGAREAALVAHDWGRLSPDLCDPQAAAAAGSSSS
jgi:pimeloyl-ACP methyl ester carboxylesterase